MIKEHKYNIGLYSANGNDKPFRPRLYWRKFHFNGNTCVYYHNTSLCLGDDCNYIDTCVGMLFDGPRPCRTIYWSITQRCLELTEITLLCASEFLFMNHVVGGGKHKNAGVV